MTTTDQLRAAPATIVDGSGRPAFGTYQGPFAIIDLRALRPPFGKGAVDRLRHHKKWVYLFASDEQVSVLCAIVDTTYAATAFVAVTDMRSGEVVVDRSVMSTPGPLVRVGDHPAAGLHASLRSPLGSFRVDRPAGSGEYRLVIASTPPIERLGGVARAAVRATVRAGGSALRALPLVGGRFGGGGGGAADPAARPGGARIDIDLRFAAGRTPELSVVAPVEQGGGSVNVTQKVAGLPVTGTVTVGGRTWQLSEGVGGLDYTHGYLARHTAWNWGFLAGRLDDGRRIGLNVVSGFNESRDDVNENALWVDDRLVPLDRARFGFDRADPRAPWTVATVDGSVDLVFTPYAVHAERKDLVVLTSRFLQPIGTFSGTLRIDGEQIAVSRIPGVTEDQDISW